MKKAIFGGSFDPIHNGHTALCRGVAKALALDAVVLMPTGRAPHKIKKSATTDEQRLTMCRLAVEGETMIEVSDLEIRKGGASFTIDTVETLCAAEPDTEWYLLMGADMFMTLTTWKRFEDLVKLVKPVTVPRDGVDAATLRAQARELEAFGAVCHVVELPLTPVSSTQARQAAQRGDSLADTVPPAVEQYIKKNGLYREAAVDRTAQFKEIIRARLLPDRYEHSLCVAQEARRLATMWGADPDKAFTAGLLHDIMKNTKHEIQLQILKDFDILLDSVEAASPKLLHARSGAVYVERVLGVEDPDVVSAIRYHTTARASMTLLERVLYLADFTSADRTYDDVDVMRRLVDEDADAAMRYALIYTITELAQKGAPIHPDTIGAYNDIACQRSV